jgi:ABC-type transport system involved in Fe-S cluster assembly fused permease/ATPase subunit
VARFYDPTAGSVCLDGQDLRELPVETYRRLLGIVEQDVFLFDGTIGENIGYAVRMPRPSRSSGRRWPRMPTVSFASWKQGTTR